MWLWIRDVPQYLFLPLLTNSNVLLYPLLPLTQRLVSGIHEHVLLDLIIISACTT